MKNKYVRLSTIGLAALLILAAGICPAGAFEAKVSGQVNHLFMYADDGTEENFLIGDNDNSSTRFRFTGEENFGMVKAGFTMEMEMESNTSSSMTIDQQDDGATTSLKERILEGYFNTPYGKISIGQGDGAANGTSEVDLSGTTVINYSDTLATAGSFSFRTSGGGTGPTVSETRNNFDGLSRNDRIRYDSPTIAGFFLSTSMTNGEAWEIAGRYNRDFSGNKVAVGIGYVGSRERLAMEFKQLGCSAAWLSPTGLNLSVTYGSRDYENDATEDAVNYYGKIGYIYDIHAFSIEYGKTEDYYANGSESANYGLAYVVKPWNGVEFYASYRAYQYEDDTTTDFDDITQFMAGTRIKF